MTTRSRSGQAFTAVTQVPALAAALHSGLGLHHHNILLILWDDGVVFVYVSLPKGATVVSFSLLR